MDNVKDLIFEWMLGSLHIEDLTRKICDVLNNETEEGSLEGHKLQKILDKLDILFNQNELADVYINSKEVLREYQKCIQKYDEKLDVLDIKTMQEE